MRPDHWHLTDDVHGFLARAGDFLRSRPASHTMLLTVTERMRTSGAAADGTLFGVWERDGAVGAVCYRRAPTHRLSVSSLTREQADTLATRLDGTGLRLSGVTGDQDSAAAFAGAWQRRTGAVPALGTRLHLYRLGTLTPPRPAPEGRGRLAGEEDLEQVVRWCGGFLADVGEEPAPTWGQSRFAVKRFTFWETPDGVPVSMAGATSLVGGMIRVDPVYTPAHLRGRGHAGAVTVEVARAAPAEGAAEIVLFTDPANPTSNALYQRVGYVRVTDFAVYGFSRPAPAPAS
ncbi:GNAT family N-acetyltransferase [Streptomyces fradiae]|uniref:GNAT family N-acetyltransferase n=1 Tax=Streptomyces fradiae TaxID=1906 RepID=UPI00382903EA